ncbi:MAG: chemotaxis protein CheR, partial [Desulfamplus sp.]|nr:chemotaxis protein CheR [Desulfamplus sp.]
MKLTQDQSIFEVSRWIVEKTVIYFPQERFHDRERVLKEAAGDLGFVEINAFISWLIKDKITSKQFDALVCRLTIGETYFYRDKKIFQALEQHILPDIISRKQKSEQILRIWSAGCSTGEEPYSIAILLSRLIPDLKEWGITILATDINRMAIDKALCGRYGNWSFRNTPSWLKESYFRQTEKYVFEILPKIKDMV